VRHSAKSFFAECPKKHSAKYLVLGKEPNSGSGYVSINIAELILYFKNAFVALEFGSSFKFCFY
jgi:hypothetical protein